MTSFLSDLAQSLYKKHGDDISKLTIVFPSRRARYYFSRSLAAIISKPVWQPKFMGIDEFIHGSSPLKVADSYQLIIELYRTFTAVKQSSESFDQFYFWGEALLNDFDAVDKYLVDAPAMFRNLADEKVFTEDLSFLTDEQQAVIASFWESFRVNDASKSNEMRGRFLSVWDALLPIYEQLTERLRGKGIAYSGMVYRDMAERIRRGETPFENTSNVVLAGFNALNRCEQVLFDHLKKQGASFYYDYDAYYIDRPEQEAGMFLRRNLADFPEAENLNPQGLFLAGDKQIDIVATPSDTVQAKYAAQLAMDAVASGAKAEHTAIVFTNENLLIPVLSGISYTEDDNATNPIDTVNVTMGYPLKVTPVYSLIENILSLYRTLRRSDGGYLFYHKDVLAIISHQLVRELGGEAYAQVADSIRIENRIFIRQQSLSELPVVGPIFSIELSEGGGGAYQRLSATLIALLEQLLEAEGAKADSSATVYVEFISHALVALRKLHSSLVREGMELSLQVFVSLVRKALANVRIPFEGFPVAGLQLMGILETRNLDFENVIILSLNDDQFPAASQPVSFIPYSIKRAFGMPTYEQQEAMYAYYFFRLLQRAKNIKLMYNTKADERSSGEMSRFLQQLKFESGLPIAERSITYSLGFQTPQPITIAKNDEVMAILGQYTDESGRRSLSPSAISTYLDCRLKFYFSYIAGIKEEDEVEEEISSQIFGKILHEAMDILYKEFGSESIPADALEALARSTTRIDQAIDQAFAKEFIRSDEGRALQKLNGKFLLVRRVVSSYIRGVLRYDARTIRDGKTLRMVALEEAFTAYHPFAADGQAKKICFRGRLDRVDNLSGVTRIVDYKTGGYKDKNTFRSIEKMFVGDDTAKYKGAMQTFLYSLMYSISKGDAVRNIKPALYFVRAINTEEFNPYLSLKDGRTATEVENFFDYRNEFIEYLNPVLAEIFGADQPFDQTGNPTRMCQPYCPYNAICKR